MTQVLQLKTLPATCYWTSNRSQGPRPIHCLHLNDDPNSVAITYIDYSLPEDLNQPREYQGYRCMVWKPSIEPHGSFDIDWDTTMLEVAKEDLEGAKREAIKYAQSLGRIPMEIEVKK